jgi:hypothetical protein
VEIAVLGFLWFIFLILTFRSPGAPKLSRLLSFLVWFSLCIALGYVFAVKVLDWDPVPTRWRIAHWLTDDKIIDLAEIAPGVYHPNYIHRVDTDVTYSKQEPDEWLTFYQYDVVGASKDEPRGPFGAAIYDPDRCRPPAILSYELVPVSYDYLGQDAATVKVDNIIEYKDPLSGGQDRPEVIIAGFTRGVATDLNIFRKVGSYPDCFEIQQLRQADPNLSLPYAERLDFDNVGSFRGTYRIKLDGNTVTVWDRGGFERSQLTIKRVYKPQNGSYFRLGTKVLLDPAAYSVDFGPGQPDDIPTAYYPEKAVLAFYSKLGKDRNDLQAAETYLSPYAQQIYDIRTDPFGMSTEPSSPAQARKKLAGASVLEIRYDPDIQAEQLHEDRDITVTVVGIDDKGETDYNHPCQVTWTVVGIENPQALPYGCEWRLESYWTTCVPMGQQGK